MKKQFFHSKPLNDQMADVFSFFPDLKTLLVLLTHTVNPRRVAQSTFAAGNKSPLQGCRKFGDPIGNIFSLLFETWDAQKTIDSITECL